MLSCVRYTCPFPDHATSPGEGMENGACKQNRAKHANENSWVLQPVGIILPQLSCQERGLRGRGLARARRLASWTAGRFNVCFTYIW